VSGLHQESTADERCAQGRYDEAEPLYLRALGLAEGFCGQDQPVVATICNNLAVLYKYTGKFDEAAQLYRQALPLLEQSLGTEHTEIAALYHNLGGLEHARGRFAEGEPLARRSVEIRERALGPDHPHVAADIAALAAILDGLGRYDESEQHLRRAEELAPAIRDPQAIAPTIGVRMRLLLARGHYDVGDAVHRIEPMIDDPIAYYIVPLIARVEATGALLAHDAGAPRRISRLVDLLRTVHDSVVPGQKPSRRDEVSSSLRNTQSVSGSPVAIA